jgi:hypothetical protein
MRIGRSKENGPAPDLGPRETKLPDELLWLADAPLFIDERRIDAFYDAVFRPDYGEITRTLQEKVTRDTTLSGGFTLGSLLPGLFAKAEATLSAEHSRGGERGQELALQPVSNPYRHLLALVLHYSTEPDKQRRLVLARTPNQARDGAGQPLPPDWLQPDSDFIRTPPRAMILLDLAEGCKLIPAAVELSDGTVKPLFKDLEEGLKKEAKTPPPTYPGSHADLAKRNAYWQWFAENFNDRVALDAVERAGSGQKIQWIAYRVSFGDNTGPFLHLALAARGTYDTGVFGYNFINRGTKHGLRLVGTLKTEPDIDVLAVFER